MPFRTSAKPPEVKKELLYKKPWWQIWTDRATYTRSDGQRYVWYYIKKWERYGAATKKDRLYYTTTGTWVFIARGVKDDEHDMSRMYIWHLFDDCLEGLEKQVENIDVDDLTEALEKLIDVKEKDDQGEKPIIWL